MDNKKFEEYANNKDIKNIIYAVNSKYPYIPDDDKSSISLTTLWKCIERYDETRGTKFTSYLYQQLVFAYKNELKKKSHIYPVGGIKELDCIVPPVAISSKSKRRDTAERKIMHEYAKSIIEPIIESVSDGHRNILNQRYFHNMTMKEIAKQNGYSRETARRQLKKAINECKKISKI